MTWFKVDDGLAFHHKIVKAGNAAMGLWVRAGSYASATLTDGFVPDHMVTLLGTPAQRRKLVAAGLWIEGDGGVWFHEWAENGRQPTSQSVRENRAKNAARQQRHRDKKSGKYTEVPQVEESRNAVTGASVTGEVTSGVTTAPTRPDPTNTPTGAAAEPRPPQREPAEDEPEPVNLVAQRITRAYYEREPMCKFPAVMRVVKKAIGSGRYSEQRITEALLRMADDGRSVTVDGLRYELDGFPARNRQPALPDTDPAVTGKRRLG